MGSRIGGTFNYQSDDFHCPKCGKPGAIIWEPALSANGPASQFIKVTGDFYERIVNAPPYAIELVCRGCGGVQQIEMIPGSEFPNVQAPQQDDPR